MWQWYYLSLKHIRSEQIERALESEKPTPPPRQSRNVYHAPLPTPPPDDDMEPQSVSFVQDDAVPISSDTTSLSSKKSSLHQITSGSKTYVYRFLNLKSNFITKLFYLMF